MLLKRALEEADYENISGLKYTQLVTGTYDLNTFEAVKWYQRRNGLIEDGIAGFETIDSLCQTALYLLENKL